MSASDWLITIGILLAIFIMIYARLKNQTLREAFEEFKELFVSAPKPFEPTPI